MKNILKHTIAYILGIITAGVIVYLFRGYFAALLIYIMFKS